MSSKNIPKNSTTNASGLEIQKESSVIMSDELIQLRSNVFFNSRYKFLGRKTEKNSRHGYFECKEHHTLFEQSLNTHLMGRVPKGCPQCHREILSKTISSRANIRRSKGDEHHKSFSAEHIQQKCKELFKGRIKFLRRDENSYVHGLYECPHGLILRNRVSQILQGTFPSGCEKCYKEIRKRESKLTAEYIREKSYAQFEGKVYYLDRYDKMKNSGIFLCREHGITFTQRLHKHFNGQNGCSLCQQEDSKLSRLTYEELRKTFSQDEIVKEKSFEDCRNLHLLKFDFYIEKLNLLIECDGEGHFFNIAQWNGEEGLRLRIHNDQIKDTYTWKSGFNFLRIAFYELKNMSTILEESIKKIQKGERVYRVHHNQLPS